MDDVKKENFQRSDSCCGTTFQSTSTKDFRCIGEGFASWVKKDWMPGDRPESAHICPCRKMSLSEYRQFWVNKYLRNCEGMPDKNAVNMYQRETQSFYIQAGVNINATILAIAGMSGIKSLLVTGLDDTFDILGKPYLNGQFYQPYESLWICMDVDRAEPCDRIRTHLSELIIKSGYGKTNIILSGTDSWGKFSVKHGVDKLKFKSISG